MNGEVQRLLRFRLEDFIFCWKPCHNLEMICARVDARGGRPLCRARLASWCQQIDLGTDAHALVLSDVLPRLTLSCGLCGNEAFENPASAQVKGRAEHMPGAPVRNTTQASERC